MAVVIKIDLKKELKNLYKPSAKKVSIVNVPEMKFLMLNGRGVPERSQEFQDAIQAVYGVAYTIKFTLKEDPSIPDFTVMPLESLWWISGGATFDKAEGSAWRWTVMVAQPHFITEEHLAAAKKKLKQKAGGPSVSNVRLRSFDEGLSAQMMHIGSYSSIGDSVKKVEDYAKENGYKLRGRHHEIYLSDPRRVAPEKLKTIVRRPLK
jgi:hypothetical protein